jgi:hypothetical protein
MKALIALSITVFVTAPCAVLAAKCKSPVNLKEFSLDSKKFMNGDIIKLDKNCKRVHHSVFSKEQIESKSFIEIKDRERSKLCHTTKDKSKKICLRDLAPGEDVLAGRAPIESVDNAENLVTGNELIDTLEMMEELNLTGHNLVKRPWSDWYWPIAVGQLSFRYADDSMVTGYQEANLEEAQIWPWMNEYHLSNPAMATPEDINKLSPSEKYDLLMGDTNYTLTKNQLEAGKTFYDNYGKVESWMGLCHGWAPASYMLPRPISSVVVKTANTNQDLTFIPSDIKALGSLLWAKGQQQNKFIGGRCNKKEPTIDKETGRILDQECFDNNPASWHMAITTELGFNNKPFVMDATFDYEVWNHPVVGYSVYYFNPNTLDKVSTLKEAKISLEDFKKDKFKKFRSPNAKYFVGITMEVEYAIETMPSNRKHDNESYDASNTAYYTYDLELDENGKIIGGEWYNNKHPDFLWTPYEGSHAVTALDQHLPEILTLDQITHPSIIPYVPQLSTQGQPIGKVVEALFRESALENVKK